MFAGNPETLAYFNPAHQHAGDQQRALAGAICAYAANIDNLAALGPAVELIAQKHCSLGIRPEHYPIVGKHLLVAIKDVLGDAATDEVIAAWGEAYGLLAKIFIDREAEIYRQQAAAPGGWNGYRRFVVDRKRPRKRDRHLVLSAPGDGGPLPTFKPGQYITVNIDRRSWQRHRATTACRTVPASATIASASSAKPGPTAGAPAGLMSNYLARRCERRAMCWKSARPAASSRSTQRKLGASTDRADFGGRRHYAVDVDAQERGAPAT